MYLTQLNLSSPSIVYCLYSIFSLAEISLELFLLFSYWSWARDSDCNFESICPKVIEDTITLILSFFVQGFFLWSHGLTFTLLLLTYTWPNDSVLKSTIHFRVFVFVWSRLKHFFDAMVEPKAWPRLYKVIFMIQGQSSIVDFS